MLARSLSSELAAKTKEREREEKRLAIDGIVSSLDVYVYGC